MKAEQKKTLSIAVAGIVLVIAILVFGTIWTGHRAQKDTAEVAHSVSQMYLDELAGRREQVVEDNLQKNIDTIDITLGMINGEDLSDLEHMRSYQRNIKKLFSLERFAFVDEDGMVYTADEGVRDDMDRYSFDYKTLDKPSITVENVTSSDKRIVIAVPIRDKNLSIDGEKLVVCFMEQDSEIMLKGISMETQDTEATFCNIYTSEGRSLCDTVLGEREYLNDVQVETEGEVTTFIYGGDAVLYESDENHFDVIALENGYASITPLQKDMTAYKAGDMLADWRIGK